MNMQAIFRRLLATAIAGAGLLAIGQAQAAETFRVGAYPANPPWESKAADGSFSGLEVDIVNEIGRRIGRTVTIEGMDFKALFVAAASNRVDAVISSLTITPERLKNQSFTQPFFDGELALVVTDKSGIGSIEDMKGRSIGSVATSSPETWAKANMARLGFSTYRSYDGLNTLFLDVRTGRLDAAVSDAVGSAVALRKMPGLKIAARVSTGDRFGIMMGKNSPLLKPVNDAISDMKRDGTMARLIEKWMGLEPRPGDSSVTVLPLP